MNFLPKINQEIIKSLGILTLVFLLNLTLHAQYYWVGGSGNWSDYANHWATSSGGNEFQTQAPTFEDDVFFDANSFSASDQIVTFDENTSVCRNFDCSGISNSPTFEMPYNYELKIYGYASFNDNATYNVDNLRFYSQTSPTNISINNADLSSSRIQISGNAAFDLQGDLTCSHITISQGTFNTNNFTITTQYSFTITGNLMSTTNLGSSEIHCTDWHISGNNSTLNAGTSIIYVKDIANFEGNVGTINYNNVSLIAANCSIEGNAFYNVIDATDTRGHALRFGDQSTTTCNQFIFDATRNEDGYMYTFDNQEALLVISASTTEITYVRMKNIHVAGEGSHLVNPGTDLGNNDGWDFIPVEPLYYYWVGNGGDWDDLNHWSSTSGGSPDYTIVSSHYDHVIFDENSITSSDQTVTLQSSVYMKSLDCSALNSSILLTTEGGSQHMYFYGDLIFGDNVDKDLNSLYFAAENTGLIDFGNQGIVNTISLDNDAQYELLSNINCHNLNVYHGVIITNDYQIDCANTFHFLNGLEAYNYLGSSQINTHDFKIFNNQTNIDFGTSTIVVTGDFEGNNYSFYRVVLEEEGSIFDNNSFEFLEFSPGVISELEAGTTQTVVNLSINGNGVEPVTISSDEEGVQATLSKSSGTVTATYVNLKDNLATGGATFNAVQSVDLGNNTGWNIVEIQPQTFYWVGGSGNWSDHDNHWATSSAGTNFFAYVPTPLDDVVFDGNSFDQDNQTVTIDLDVVNCKSMEWIGITNNPHLNGSASTINLYGGLTFSENMTIDIDKLSFLSEDAVDITPGGTNSPGENTELNFLSNGVFNLQGNLIAKQITLERGTLNTNDHDITLAQHFLLQDYGDKVLNLGTSTLECRDFKWQNANGGNFTLEGSNSNIICNRGFLPIPNEPELVNINVNNLHFAGVSEDIAILDRVTLNELLIDAGKTVRLIMNDTITVNSLIAEGSAENHIILKSASSTMESYLRKTSGTVIGNYLEIENIHAIGGATFYAENSLDLGGNSGWIFGNVSIQEPPTSSQLLLYPNPTQGKLLLRGNEEEILKISVYNLLGTLVMETNFKAHSFIDLSRLTSGIYTMQLQTKENQLITHKIYKN